MENGNSKIARKILETMQLIGPIRKTGFNQFDRYNFVEAKEVFERVRKACEKTGLAIVPSGSVLPVERTTAKGTPIKEVLLTLTLIDSDSGESMAITWHGEAMDTSDKGIQKAFTSAEKYALMKLFLIGDDDDPDASSDAQNPAVEQKVQNPASKLLSDLFQGDDRKEFLDACAKRGVKAIDVGKTALEKGVRTKEGVLGILEEMGR